MELLKTYKTERPVNSASISPLFDHVVLGGGQEAMDVSWNFSISLTRVADPILQYDFDIIKYVQFFIYQE